MATYLEWRRSGSRTAWTAILVALTAAAWPARAVAEQADGPGMEAEALEPSVLPGADVPRFTIHEENDAFGMTRTTDNYYTQGLQISARWRPPDGWRVVERCQAGATVRSEQGCELWGFELGQNIYTPTRITETDLSVLVHDRPYAGYLYVGPTFEAQLPWSPIPRRAWLVAGPGESRALVTSALRLVVRVGQTGPQALGGAVQTGFHTLLNEIEGNHAQDLPAGWRIYETRNFRSLDATAELTAGWVRLSAPLPWVSSRFGSRLALRAAPGGRLDLGGMVDAAGLSFASRMGLLADDVGEVNGSSRVSTEPRWLHAELYLWVEGAGRFVAYNRFIEGELLHGVKTDVKVSRWVGDLVAGVVLRVGVLELAISQHWRTAEFHPVPRGGPRVDNFGSFRLGFLFD